MKRAPLTLRLSATDLANHLACRHLTTLDRGAAEGEWDPPDWYRPEAAILRERGLEHERAYVAHLEAQGKSIARPDAPDEDEARGVERTMKAMLEGREVILQAALGHERWGGRADVLIRVERRSRLGSWSYEALDTKLSRETKAGAILQLCLYSKLLEELQGELPEFMHVVPRNPDLAVESYRVGDYLAYARLVQRRLEGVLDAPGSEDGATYPEPVGHCDVCRWWPRCDRQRRQDDHLSLVAGISRMQRRELQGRAVTTLAGLAAVPLPLGWKPARGAKEGYERVREQARVQLQGRMEKRTLHELLKLEEGRGLAALPPPSPGDLFLDLEADPYVDEGGIEYLFGWVGSDPSAPAPAAPSSAGVQGSLGLDFSAPAYHARWALDRAGERRAFEELVDTILARWDADPEMHVYHFGAYEPGALKRLMGRHATREAEVDRLLRAERFVDLHAVVKHALLASVEEYSIKKLEPLYGFTRLQALDQAGTSLRVLQRGLELGIPVDPESPDARVVEAYNRDDCFSARELRDWLEIVRAEVENESGEALGRPQPKPGDPNEQIGDRERRARELAERLRAGVPEDRAKRDEDEDAAARWLLSHLLDWHRREEKAPWWEYYRLRALSDEALLDETAALSGLEFVERVVDGRSPVDRYRFPAQETGLRKEDSLELPLPHERKFGEIQAIDLLHHTIDVKKPNSLSDFHPKSVFRHEVVSTKVLAESLMRLGTWVAEHGVDAPGPNRAARDLLRARGPRIAGHDGGALRLEGETGVQAARRLALALDRGTLAIQGPPGSGKTYTGARMILDLVRAGKKVGVCALSHKVIANLLAEVSRAAAEEKVAVACVRKVSKPSETATPGVVELDDNAEVRAAIRGPEFQVAAGTPWLWAREEFAQAVDVLFVDEAGQMSLANVLAIAQGGTSLVLLGDPQQLEQPIQGSHPEGTAISALEHVLGDHDTIPPERGLFLEETWRMAPALCALTSELFYEGKLHPHPGLERQALVGDTPFAGAGLWFVPLDHDANQSASREEVAAIAAIVNGLMRPGAVRWRDRHGEERPLRLEDVLIIAPYNAQVADLLGALPAGARVGTVDRFQGQEAPVVIYSLTSSTPEDAPRGMEFLYNPNRFNVATSRARCACIVVGNPRLFAPECETPRQIRLANAFCRYLEVAAGVAIA